MTASHVENLTKSVFLGRAVRKVTGMLPTFPWWLGMLPPVSLHGERYKELLGRV